MKDTNKQIIMDYIDKNKGELFSLLSELIKINSENFGTYGNEKEIAHYISNELSEAGIENRVYSPDSVEGILEHKDYLCGRNMADRPNVTGYINGTDAKSTIMLAAHIDTVPIGDRALWGEEPLGGAIKNGRIYGRGACDDKYGIATSVFILKMLKKLNLSLKNNLYFTGYADEEFGGGNGALAACLEYPCDAVINLDCSNMRILNCACGGRREVLTLKKDSACDTCNEMIEAIYIAKEELHTFGASRKKELSENSNFNGTDIADKSMRILNIQSGINTNDRNIGHIEFSYCTDKEEEFIKKELFDMTERINNRTKDIGVYVLGIEPRTRYFRYTLSASDNPYIKLLQNNIKSITGKDVNAMGASLSDLNIFINTGNEKSFSFGAGRGFMEEGGSHLTDEFIECDKFVDFTKTVAAFICDWGEL